MNASTFSLFPGETMQQTLPPTGAWKSQQLPSEWPELPMGADRQTGQSRTGPGRESCSEHPSCQSSFIHSFIHSRDVGSPGGIPAQSPPPSWGRLGWHRAYSQGTASLRRWLLQERGGRAGWQGGRALHGRPTKITPQTPSPPPP